MSRAVFELLGTSVFTYITINLILTFFYFFFSNTTIHLWLVCVHYTLKAGVQSLSSYLTLALVRWLESWILWNCWHHQRWCRPESKTVASLVYWTDTISWRGPWGPEQAVKSAARCCCCCYKQSEHVARQTAWPSYKVYTLATCWSCPSISVDTQHSRVSDTYHSAAGTVVFGLNTLNLRTLQWKSISN